MSTSEQSVPQPSAAPQPVAQSAVTPSVTPAVGSGAQPATQPVPPQAPGVGPSQAWPAAPQVEIVPRGILFSLAAVPLGMVLSVLIWKLGFVASISSFVVAGAAVWLYTKGATQVPRRGLVPVIAVILVGVAASFFAIVAADLADVYSTQGDNFGYSSSVDFVSANLFNPSVLGAYGSDLVMFVVFAALGVFGTLRRLLALRRA